MKNTVCPKCQHVRQDHEPGPYTDCPRCGVIYARYRPPGAARGMMMTSPLSVDTTQAESRWQAMLNQLKRLIVTAPETVRREQLLAETLLWAILLVWGWSFVMNGWRGNAAGHSFLHSADLPFHEFGHLLFRPFGEWWMFLGGSLFQCLLPLILAFVFLWRERQRFSAAVSLWWLGQNMVDVAPYIGDARALALPLVGEYNDEIVEIRQFRHDWHNILEQMGWLRWDERLASIAQGLGSLIIGLALMAAALHLLQCYQVLNKGNSA